MTLAFANIKYEGSQAQTSWKGIGLQECPDFDIFMRGPVANRLHDTEGRNNFHTQLQGLALTDFGKTSLEDILNAEVPEEREWAVGEALAEAFLTEVQGVQWPWNMERDKRNPKASLAGADIVGFIPCGSHFRLALGEVKTSTEEKYPPQVMSGRSGMEHQIDALAENLNIICQLLKWLYFRCKNTEFEKLFKDAVSGYCNSGNKAVTLFGVLIRDTNANNLDLSVRGISLGIKIPAPAFCNLIAVYLPHSITDLPRRVEGGVMP